MPILYRYLVQNFLQSLVIFYITFAGLYVVIDAFGNLEEFINHASKAGGLFVLLAKYYGPRTLVIFDRTSGVLTLIAAMFTLTALERHNELTALYAAGISRGRLAKPMIICVIFVSLLAVANREFLLPRFRDELSRNAQDFAGERGRVVKPQYDAMTDVYFNGRFVFLGERKLDKTHLRLPSTLAAYGTLLVADHAINEAATAEHPAGWHLKRVSQPNDLSHCDSVKFGEKPTLLFPKDHPWLKPDECFLVSDVRIEQLANGNFQRLASTTEMIAALRNPSSDFGPDLRVSVHSRIVQPLLEIALLFLGLPFVLGRDNRNIFVAMGMCAGIVAGFFLVMLTCHGLGNNCLISPALAAWAPLAICTPIAMVLSEPLRE